MTSKNFARSIFFRRALGKAFAIVNDPNQMNNLVNTVKTKISNIDEGRHAMDNFLSKIKTLMRMVRDYIRGDYREIPWKSLIMILAGLLYFLMPLDAIPDFIPGAGFIDDISIIMLVFKSISDDIHNYELFEESRIEEIGSYE